MPHVLLDGKRTPSPGPGPNAKAGVKSQCITDAGMQEESKANTKAGLGAWEKQGWLRGAQPLQGCVTRGTVNPVPTARADAVPLGRDLASYLLFQKKK